MIEVGWYSLKLFLKGKLLRNPGYFYRQVTVGVIIGLLLLLGLEKTGLNLAIVIGVSSLLTGMAMPFLLKDIKMK